MCEFIYMKKKTCLPTVILKLYQSKFKANSSIFSAQNYEPASIRIDNNHKIHIFNYLLKLFINISWQLRWRHRRYKGKTPRIFRLPSKMHKPHAAILYKYAKLYVPANHIWGRILHVRDRRIHRLFLRNRIWIGDKLSNESLIIAENGRFLVTGCRKSLCGLFVTSYARFPCLD